MDIIVKTHSEPHIKLSFENLSEGGSELNHCSLNIHPLPGSRYVHLEFCDSTEPNKTLSRIEVEVGSDQPFTCELCYDRDHHIEITESNGRKIYYLPATNQYRPHTFRKPSLEEGIDLAVIVDATMITLRQRHKDQQGEYELLRLLDNPAQWSHYIEKISGLIAELNKHYSEIRVCLYAFGDHQPPYESIKSLTPSFLLDPENPADLSFVKFSSDVFSNSMLKLQASSGGDVVDALADSLAAANALHWRQTGTRMILIIGDSPGYSLRHPISIGSGAIHVDNCIRTLCLDHEILKLHRNNIEIATLFKRPEQSSDEYELINESYLSINFRTLIQQTIQQYTRLSTCSRLNWTTQEFDSINAANSIKERPEYLLRDSAYPMKITAKISSCDL